MSAGGRRGAAPRRSVVLAALTAASLLAMALWFSASAVAPQLRDAWSLSGGQIGWLTASVQLGFVVGALVSALLMLPDRVPAHTVFVLSAIAGALLNAGIPALGVGYGGALVLRFLTGVALAGVYPVGMKLMASWCVSDRGFCVGLLVGALTVGSASPHLFDVVLLGTGAPPEAWRPVLWVASASALAAAVLVAGWVRPGPSFAPSAPFRWGQVGNTLRERPLRLANFGYLGHMWELYAVWAWVPIFLLEALGRAGWSEAAARLAAFTVIAVGGVSSVLAGRWADAYGRTAVTMASLALSGACSLAVGALGGVPWLALAVALVWGFAVIADSAQYSSAITELADQRYVGTALTVQTSLGFLLTLGSIRLTGWLSTHAGWWWAFAVLVVGPLFGLWSMARLRRLPQAAAMAGGRR